LAKILWFQCMLFAGFHKNGSYFSIKLNFHEYCNYFLISMIIIFKLLCFFRFFDHIRSILIGFKYREYHIKQISHQLLQQRNQINQINFFVNWFKMLFTKTILHYFHSCWLDVSPLSNYLRIILPSRYFL